LSSSIFDFVLLSNVLHEIPVLEWEAILLKIKDSLKDGGFLIILEDTLMPKGEMIGEVGFLVLDVESVQKLFSLAEPPSQIIPSKEKYLNRILCCVIEKNQIQSISKGGIVAALKTLQQNCFKNIKRLRKLSVKEESKLSIGRESAFYSQLYLNTMLAIEKLENLTVE
jgi:hypothetical protein